MAATLQMVPLGAKISIEWWKFGRFFSQGENEERNGLESFSPGFPTVDSPPGQIHHVQHVCLRNQASSQNSS